MILVDTSVMIDFLKDVKNKSTEKFERVIDQKIPFGIHHLIYLEILQGAKTEKDYITLKKYLDSQHFFDLKNSKKSYADAAKMYMILRKKGVTVRSSFDCLLAQVSIENDLFLLHNDQDFTRIAKHFPLKIWDF